MITLRIQHLHVLLADPLPKGPQGKNDPEQKSCNQNGSDGPTVSDLQQIGGDASDENEHEAQPQGCLPKIDGRNQSEQEHGGECRNEGSGVAKITRPRPASVSRQSGEDKRHQHVAVSVLAQSKTQVAEQVQRRSGGDEVSWTQEVAPRCPGKEDQEPQRNRGSAQQNQQ